MKTENSPADANRREAQQDHEKTTLQQKKQNAAQKPAQATPPPLSESPKSQMNVYQQLREMDNELAKNEPDSNSPEAKPAL